MRQPASGIEGAERGLCVERLAAAVVAAEPVLRHIRFGRLGVRRQVLGFEVDDLRSDGGVGVILGDIGHGTGPKPGLAGFEQAAPASRPRPALHAMERGQPEGKSGGDLLRQAEMLHACGGGVIPGKSRPDASGARRIEQHAIMLAECQAALGSRPARHRRG